MSCVEESYAKALFRASDELGVTDSVLDEIKLSGALISEHIESFANLGQSATEAADILRSVFFGRFSLLTAEFVCLLAKRRKLKLLPGIVTRFEKLVQSASGIVEIDLSLPFEPDEGLLKRLRVLLAARKMYPEGLRDNVIFNVKIDKSLLGGFIAECGGRVLDFSLKRRLENLKEVGKCL